MKNKKVFIVLIALICSFIGINWYLQYDVTNSAIKTAKAYKEYYTNNKKLPVAMIDKNNRCVYDGTNLLVVSEGTFGKQGVVMINYVDNQSPTENTVWQLVDMFKTTNPEVKDFDPQQVTYLYGNHEIVLNKK